MFYVSISGTLDINSNLNGGASDAGVTYEVPAGCASLFAVNASTGLVTPAATGMGVVLVKNASTGVVLRRLPVCVLSVSEFSIRQQLASGAVTLATGIAAANGA
jgi:hypothetical protein